MAAFADSLSLTFPILRDPEGRIQRIYQTTGVPESFVVGRDGVIYRKLIGPTEWDRRNTSTSSGASSAKGREEVTSLSGLFSRNWFLKLSAFVVALLLWIAVRAEAPSRQELFGIPGGGGSSPTPSGWSWASRLRPQ